MRQQAKEKKRLIFHLSSFSFIFSVQSGRGHHVHLQRNDTRTRQFDKSLRAYRCFTVVVVNHAERVRVGVAEKLASNDVRVALHQREVLAVKAVLKPMQRLAAIVSLVTEFFNKRI